MPGSPGRDPGSAQAWGFYSPRGKRRAADAFTAHLGTLGSPSENPFLSCVTDRQLGVVTEPRNGESPRPSWGIGGVATWGECGPSTGSCIVFMVFLNPAGTKNHCPIRRESYVNGRNVLCFGFSFCNVFFLNLWCCPRTSLSLTWCPVQWAPHSSMRRGRGQAGPRGQGLRGRSPRVAAHFLRSPHPAVQNLCRSAPAGGKSDFLVFTVHLAFLM